MNSSLRKTLVAVAISALIGGAGTSFAADPAPAAGAEKKVEAAKPADSGKQVVADKHNISYMVGMDLGRSLGQIKEEIDLAVVIQALQASMKGDKTELTQDEAVKVRQDFMQKLQAKQATKEKEAAEKNKKESEDFLAKNKSKAGVKTTASGLQYEIVKDATGPKPKATDTVKVSYVGTKVDGTKFDASADHGGPATFPVSGVIPGWTEALQLMSVGSKYKLYIPSNLAYADHAPGPIGPNAALIFDVELVSIEQPAPAAKPEGGEKAPAAAKPAASKDGDKK